MLGLPAVCMICRESMGERLGKALGGGLKLSLPEREVHGPTSVSSISAAPKFDLTARLKSHMVVRAGTALCIHAAFSVSRSRPWPPQAPHLAKMAAVAIIISVSAPRQTPGNRAWQEIP